MQLARPQTSAPSQSCAQVLDTVAVNALPGQPDCLALLKLAVPVTLVEVTNLPDSLIVAAPASPPFARCRAVPL
jgi:hypothetical protein